MICMRLVRAPVGKTLVYALSSILRRLRWVEDVTLYSSQQLARCCKREGPRRRADRRKEKRKNNPGRRSFSFSAFKTSEAMHYSPRKTRNTPRHEGAGESAESKKERRPGRQHFIPGRNLLECKQADAITDFRGKKTQNITSEWRVGVVEQERRAFKASNWLISIASVRGRELISEITCSAVGFFQ